MLLVLATVVVSFAACNGKTPVGSETSPVTDPQHEHAFGEWVTVKVPNCTEKGEKSRACACGEKETEELAVTDEQGNASVSPSPTRAFVDGDNVSVIGTDKDVDKLMKQVK